MTVRSVSVPETVACHVLVSVSSGPRDAVLPPLELPPPELPLPELPPPEPPLSGLAFLALPEEPVQPAARQSMMTMMVTRTIYQNPGGIRHVPDFPTIDFSCCPDSYCSRIIKEEYLISGTHGGMNRET
jgi:hypothetical protein